LKHINEKFGWTAGNAALRHVARSLMAELQSGDLLFRYKSDEFIAVLNSVDSSAMVSFLAHVKNKLEASAALQGLMATRLEVAIKQVHTTSDTELQELLSKSGDAKTAMGRFHIH
jgi:diguanylate cyclase (GGDEF)-like protein